MVGPAQDFTGQAQAARAAREKSGSAGASLIRTTVPLLVHTAAPVGVPAVASVARMQRSENRGSIPQSNTLPATYWRAFLIALDSLHQNPCLNPSFFMLGFAGLTPTYS